MKVKSKKLHSKGDYVLVKIPCYVAENKDGYQYFTPIHIKLQLLSIPASFENENIIGTELLHYK